MSNQFYPNTGKLFMKHYLPVMLTCKFKVAAADTGGLGITGLTGGGVQNVFMHTSQTPGTGNAGVVNPNPASGYIAVQLNDNYSAAFLSEYTLESPNSGSNVNIDASDAALTAGQLYVISVLGTSTAADWSAVGLPAGVTPAVGASFIAKATGAGTGTGKVQLPKATGSGLNHIEVVGSIQATLSPIVPGIGNAGGWIFLQCLAATNSSTTTLVAAAPADGTVIALDLVLSNSSLTPATASI